MAVEFGASIDPSAAELPEARRIARRADELGFEFVGIQDHPYQHRFLDTWMLIAALLAETERVRFFPNVANLPLRGPAMIAKQAASLDVLSGGRFELGLGAGYFWEGIAAMGGPRRTGAEAVDALAEGIEIIRAFWRGDDPVRVHGRFYAVDGLKPGPPPAHPIAIWVGAYQPRMLALTGRLGDGWIPSLGYLPPDQVPAARERVDEAAGAAGRDPAEIRRLYNVAGTIADGPTRELLVGPPSHWIEELARFALELGFETFVFWPREDPVSQLERFAREVVPGVRETVESR
jgi:alkanesulfonate monooxygenase SsuD/methylene tetrahydromethanopterin reductase-like flavin-dependent oxidoreductase (luciferase family)